MSEQRKEENQKTIVSFVVGLLIGGLLVWAFSGGDTTDREPNDSPRATTTEETTDDEETGTTSEESDDEDDDTPTPVATLPVGDGAATVRNQAAGTVVTLEAATFPVAEGWIGVRDYVNGQLTGLLGVARFSEEQGLVPTQIILQRATVAGREYAIVFYTENGDREFQLANDVQTGGVATTFTAQ